MAEMLPERTYEEWEINAAGNGALSTTPFADSLEHLLAALQVVDLRIRWAVARARTAGLNPDDEFRGLYVSDAQVDSLLGYDVGHHIWSNGHENGTAVAWANWKQAIERAERVWRARTAVSHHAPIHFQHLITQFSLTPVEVEALLIVLAPELDTRYERFYAYLQDDVTKKRPSVDLVLNLLTDSFAEKAKLRGLFAENGRLFQSRLLLRSTDKDTSLLSQSLRPAPGVIEYLLGHTHLDGQLTGLAELTHPTTNHPLQRTEPALLQHLHGRNQLTAPLFAFVGGYGVGKQEAAAYLANNRQESLLTVDLAALNKSELGLAEGMALVLRDGRLYHATLYLTGWDDLLQDGRPPTHLLRQLFDYPQTVIIASAVSWQPTGHFNGRPVHTVHFTVPDYGRRLHLWGSHFPDHPDLDLPALANQFHFAPGQIEDAIATAISLAQWEGEPLSTAHLFAASRLHSNQKLAVLATKIQPRYSWNDIILPHDTLTQLKEMVNTVRQRPIVYQQWGFDRKMALGKGLNALFAGESGTGKTMAADIMARELGLDLYKIDLSTVVSKYIGETEKNLDRIFTEAATSNAILFFDEADAIFGKRSEVKDSHDRYANIEISYLLQRMETYDGVVILATNLRANLDDAFTRRLHFAIEFPFPEPLDRELIWRVNFPPETPLAFGVDFKILAERFDLAGGNIRNIILAAAFLAAEEGQMVEMRHLLHATRREYQKIGRLIDERLFRET